MGVFRFDFQSLDPPFSVQSNPDIDEGEGERNKFLVEFFLIYLIITSFWWMVCFSTYYYIVLCLVWFTFEKGN
jgi:hypothetical protein